MTTAPTDPPTATPAMHAAMTLAGPVLFAPLRSVRRSLPLGQALLMAAIPHGGQRLARRNAWGGMSADAARGRGRRDADAAMRQAQSRAEGRSRYVR